VQRIQTEYAILYGESSASIDEIGKVPELNASTIMLLKYF